EHLEGGGERAGLEVVVEGVGPEDDGRPARVPRAPATVPGAEGPGREARDPTLRRHPCGAFGEPGEDRRARGQVHETGRKGREPGPPIDQPEGERGPGPEPALVVVREELGLVRRDVHVHRAVALASLAREAEVERFLDLLALPAIPDRLTLKHLEEEVRAAAG